MRVKLQCLTEERAMTFGLSYREDRKNEGLRNQDSTTIILIVLYFNITCYLSLLLHSATRLIK